MAVRERENRFDDYNNTTLVAPKPAPLPIKPIVLTPPPWRAPDPAPVPVKPAPAPVPPPTPVPVKPAPVPVPRPPVGATPPLSIDRSPTPAPAPTPPRYLPPNEIGVPRLPAPPVIMPPTGDRRDVGPSLPGTPIAPISGWTEVQVPQNAVWAGGSPPWIFDEAYGGPNPNYKVINGKVYRRSGDTVLPPNRAIYKTDASSPSGNALSSLTSSIDRVGGTVPQPSPPTGFDRRPPVSGVPESPDRRGGPVTPQPPGSGISDRRPPSTTPTPPAPPAPPANWADPTNEYLSDIAQLRAMPQGLVDSYRRWIESVKAEPLYKQGMQRDVGYLRGVPGEVEGMDRAYMTSAKENVEQRYEAAKQNVIRDAARRGLEPSSGFVQDQIRQVEEAKAKELATAERDLAMWRTNETRSRLGEARGIETQLDNLLLGRRGMESGIFGQLDQAETARRAQARGIEAALDAAERQRLMDVLGWIQGTQPSSQPVALAQNAAAMAGSQAAAANAGFGQSIGNLGQSALYYAIMTNPEWMKALTGGF